MSYAMIASLLQGIFLPTHSDVYSEPSQTSKMKLLAKIIILCELAFVIKPQFWTRTTKSHQVLK